MLTATGSSIGDLTQQIQDKLPRKVFLGHRRSIFIGEKLAREGLIDVMDQFTRNTDTRLKLVGTGRVLENNTNIDLSESSERLHVEKKLNTIKAKRVEETIKKLQTQFGQDVFGIGDQGPTNARGITQFLLVYRHHDIDLSL